MTEFWWRSFGFKITVLPWTTFLVSNGNNIVDCNFARFAANDVKGRQVATGNGASCPWQHQKLNGKNPLTFLPSTFSLSKFEQRNFLFATLRRSKLGRPFRSCFSHFSKLQMRTPMQRVTASNYKTEVVKKENTCLNKQLCTCANKTKETKNWLFTWSFCFWTYCY